MSLSLDPHSARIYICCNACKRRELDSIRVKNYLLLNGYEIVTDISLANITIFFTCSFSEEMSLDSLTKLKFYHSFTERVILCGCFPVIGMHAYDFENEIITIGNSNLNKIEYYFPPTVIKFENIPDGNDIYFDPVFGDNVFLIRISKGCLGNCSYCAIKSAIGKHESKNFEFILREISKAIESNISYIRLVADDGGAYGIDKGINIISLIKSICENNNIKGVEMEINPRWLLTYGSEFESVIANRDIYFKITIPVQSGSESVLRHMNREISMASLSDILHKVRSNVGKQLFTITHVIVGYPTETYTDIDKTIKFLSQSCFDQINIFPFTLHPKSAISKHNYTSDKSEVQNRANYMIEHLSLLGYDLFEFTKSQSSDWQHIILRKSYV